MENGNAEINAPTREGGDGVTGGVKSGEEPRAEENVPNGGS